MTNDHSQAIINMRNRTTRLEREGDYWTDEEKRQLHEMFYAGIGLSEMSIRLQRTEPAVCQQIEKMDLYHRKKRPSHMRSALKPLTCHCTDCSLYMNPVTCRLCQDGQDMLEEM